MKPNREQLLGYLLGALDEAEQVKVEQQLRHDVQLQEELERLQESLAPLADTDCDFDPPEDLAEKTCGLVAQHANAERIMLSDSGLAPVVPRSNPGRFSMADAVVAAGIFLAAGLLFFPAILHSHQLAQLTGCQNNLRQMGLALAAYSDKVGEGFYPNVATEGPRGFAGIFAPVLQDGGYLPDATWVLCPSSPLVRAEEEFRIPTLDEIDRADPQTAIVLRQRAGGSYAYNLGYIVDRRHFAPQNKGRPQFALLGDAPGGSNQLDRRAANHSGRGQNVLYDDGHVSFVVQRQANDCFDDPFRNHFGQIEAGINQNDSVIAPSFAPPIRFSTSQLRVD